MTDRIYLDNMTTTRPFESALQAMLPYWRDSFGVPLQPHEMGQELFEALKVSYEALYGLVRAKESDTFVFTSSGAEAISQVVASVVRAVVRPQGKNHLVTTAIGEAPAVLALSRLESEGCQLAMAKTPRGFLTADALCDVLTPRTALVSLSLGCALTGVIQPLEEIAALCRQRAVLLHVDVSHAIGKLPLDMGVLGVNYLTFEGSQMHAPKGTGGLFVRDAPISPLIAGEDETARLRGGPLNVPLLVALGQAALEMEQKRHTYCTEVARLKDLFERESGGTVLFADEERLPHISSITFPGIRNEALLYALNRRGVYASMGGGAFQQIERVAEASGIPKEEALCALAFGLSWETSDEEIRRAARCLQECATKLRKLSPCTTGTTCPSKPS